MNLPADFIKSINLLLDTEVDNFLDALNENAPVSVRLNPFKNKRNPKQFYHQ